MTERRFIPISVKIFIQIVLFLLYIKKIEKQIKLCVLITIISEIRTERGNCNENIERSIITVLTIDIYTRVEFTTVCASHRQSGHYLASWDGKFPLNVTE